MLKMNLVEWKELLMEVEKEKLVEILISKMMRDTYFCKEVYNELAKETISDGTVSVDQAIESYCKEVKDELEASIKSAEYLMSISYDLIEQCEHVCLIDQIKIHMTVLEEIGNALSYGAGYEDESDASAFDMLEECQREIVNILEEHLNEFTQDEIQALHELLQKALQDVELSSFVKKLQAQFSFDLA